MTPNFGNEWERNQASEYSRSKVLSFGKRHFLSTTTSMMHLRYKHETTHFHSQHDSFLSFYSLFGFTLFLRSFYYPVIQHQCLQISARLAIFTLQAPLKLPSGALGRLRWSSCPPALPRYLRRLQWLYRF